MSTFANADANASAAETVESRFLTGVLRLDALASGALGALLLLGGAARGHRGQRCLGGRECGGDLRRA